MDQIFPPRVAGFRPGYKPFVFVTGKLNKKGEVLVKFEDGHRLWMNADRCRIGPSRLDNALKTIMTPGFGA